MTENSFYMALCYLGAFASVWFVYMWAKALLSIRIESEGYYHNVKEKIVSYVLAISGAGLAAFIVYYLTKSENYGMTALIIFVVVSVLATYNLYKEENKE